MDFLSGFVPSAPQGWKGWCSSLRPVFAYDTYTGMQYSPHGKRGVPIIHPVGGEGPWVAEENNN